MFYEGSGLFGHCTLPSRAVSVGACHKSPIRQRHFSLRKHRCLRKTQRLHHFRIPHQKHRCSARDLHHPSLRQSGMTLVRRRNWKMFLVHSGWCRRPGRDKKYGAANSLVLFFWCKAAAAFVPKLPPQLNIAHLCVYPLGRFHAERLRRWRRRSPVLALRRSHRRLHWLRRSHRLWHSLGG